MSIDKLQEKIRKLKNPSVVDLTVTAQQIPPHILEEEGSAIKACGKFCLALMEGLKGIVPAVRFSFSGYALMGQDGLNLLNFLLNRAKEMGYYVLLDGVESLSVSAAENAAKVLTQWACDGLIVSPYIGTDGVKPYVKLLKETGKSLFVVIRTANKTAPELQDLMTGSRLAHMAAADMVNRLGEPFSCRCGYYQVAGVGPASSADALRALRAKYKNIFLLVDGYDNPNSNAKNCSFAFDKLGHGAIVCSGSGVSAAWMAESEDESHFVQAAVNAAERMKKNLTRYITVL